MLFNSYAFLLVFMPAVLLILGILRRLGRVQLLIPFLGIVSLIFYALWDVWS